MNELLEAKLKLNDEIVINDYVISRKMYTKMIEKFEALEAEKLVGQIDEIVKKQNLIK
jgi:hypothetical protein